MQYSFHLQTPTVSLCIGSLNAAFQQHQNKTIFFFFSSCLKCYQPTVEEIYLGSGALKFHVLNTSPGMLDVLVSLQQEQGVLIQGVRGHRVPETQQSCRPVDKTVII